MFKRFGLGVSSYFEAHTLIIKNKLWGYLLVPGIINLVLFLLFVWSAFSFANYITNVLIDFIGLSTTEDGITAALTGALFFFVSLFIKLSLLMLYFSVYKYITLILLSPILGVLSARVETILTGKEDSSSATQFVKDIVRGLRLSLRNFLIEMLCVLIGYILFYIPIVNFFVPLVLFFIQSYFFGFAMIDYTNERHKLNIQDSLKFVRGNKGLATGNGMIFSLLFLIPFVGWIVAPGYATVAATIATHKVKNNLV